MFGAPNRRAVALRVAVIVSVCMVSLAACIPADAFVDPLHSPLPTPPTRVPGEEVPFTTLWQGEFYNSCENWFAEVASLATTEEEYANILASVSWDDLPPNGFPSWESLDLGANEAVINILIGCTGGCTRDVTAKSVVKTGEQALSIAGEYGFMGPEKACPADSPSVAHLIRIPWDGTPASETQLNLVFYPAYR